MDAADELVLNARVVRLEAIADQTSKTLDLTQRRMDDGFKDLRADVNTHFRWMLGIQFTTLLAVISMLAKSGKWL